MPTSYTQDQLDAAVESKRAETSKATEDRYKADSVRLTATNKDLETMNETLTTANGKLIAENETNTEKIYNFESTPKILEEFKKQGGNENFFKDIMKIHKEEFKVKDVKIDEVIAKIKKDKDFYFTEDVPTEKEIIAAKAIGEPLGGDKNDKNKVTNEDFKNKGNFYGSTR